MIFKDTSRITRAIEFVSQRYSTDTSEQHFFHVLDVARILSEATDGNDEDLVISGLLHDIVESKLVTREELSHAFNRTVAGLVSELEDLKSSIASATKSPDRYGFHDFSDRAKMLFAADMVSMINSNPKAPQNVSRHALTNNLWQTAAVFAKCVDGINSVLEKRFHEVFKPPYEYRVA